MLSTAVKSPLYTQYSFHPKHGPFPVPHSPPITHGRYSPREITYNLQHLYGFIIPTPPIEHLKYQQIVTNHPTFPKAITVTELKFNT